MAWQYADWEQQTDYPSQRTRLIQFRGELRLAVVEKSTSDGEAIDPTTVLMMLQQTDKDLLRLNALVDAGRGAGIPRVVSTYSPRGAY